MHEESGGRPFDAQVPTIARQLVAAPARLSGEPLPEFPGRVPPDLASRYAVQEAADRVVAGRGGGLESGTAPRPLRYPSSNRTGLPARSSAAACAGPRRAAACTSRCLQAVSRRSKRSFSCASVTTLPPGRPSGPARRRRLGHGRTRRRRDGRQSARNDQRSRALRDRRRLRQQPRPNHRPRASRLARDARRGMEVRVFHRRRERRPRSRRRRTGRAFRIAALPPRVDARRS